MSLRSSASPGASPSPLRGLRAVSGRLCQAADLILLGATFLGVLLLPAFGSGNNLRQLLQLRISISNVLVAVLCLSTWRVILVSLGVYSPLRTRSMALYLFRFLIALNSCTAVVGLIEIVLHKGPDVWRSVQLFWLASLLLLTGVRGILVLTHRFLRPRPRGSKNLMIAGSDEGAPPRR